LTFGASRERRLQLPVDSYDVAGRFLDDSGENVIHIVAGRTSTLDVLIPGNSVGSLRIEVSGESGVPLTEFRYRLVSAPEWRDGRDRTLRQGVAVGDSSTCEVNGLPSGEYVLIVYKVGYERDETVFRVEGGADALVRTSLARK
jgi:hypothetical protein